MTARVTAVLEALRGHLEAVHGDRLVRCILFGSQARGEAVAGSDIDVLIVLKGPVEPGKEIERNSHFLSALCLEHETLVSCIYMDEGRFLHRQGPLLRNIRREGVAV
jgi:predicted nucleotidyltransferase